MKGVALVAAPPAVVTVIGPLAAPAGTFAVRVVEDTQSADVAFTPLNCTSARW